MSNLALRGGKPIREHLLPYACHQITRDDKKAINDVLDSAWVAGNGPTARNFEKSVCEFTGYSYAIAVNSATSGLQVAYNVSFEEDWVIDVPSLTFVATANMLLLRNKVNVIDVDADTLTVSNRLVGVSYAGHPVYNCAVADDAHSLYPNMASKKNKISVISFHPVKHITTGEGGMILTNDHSLYEWMTWLVDQGRGVSDDFGFGYNYRISELNAALGVSQLSRANYILERQQRIASRYIAVLSGLPWIVLPPTHPNHSWHLFVLRLRGIDRDWFREALLAEGIGTQVHYKPLHCYDHIEGKYGNYPVTEDVWENGVSIPLFSGMSDKDCQDVCDAIHKVIQEYEQNSSGYSR